MIGFHFFLSASQRLSANEFNEKFEIAEMFLVSRIHRNASEMDDKKEGRDRS